MKERINLLARGILDMDIPQILLMPDRIEETIQAGSTGAWEFYVNSGNGLHIKGLAYSNHTRVTVATSAFGGLRNRISYEVDARYLEDGDTIKGEFDLVMNGGEKKLPFVFHVRLGVSGQTLAGLKTPEDFAKLAKENPDTALRLFDYQDFTETCFMQDICTRAIYDGLKGHGDRGNQLEEFLVAMRLKKPVSFEVSRQLRKYDYPVDGAEGEIELRKSMWGFVSVDIQADGAFLEVQKKHISGRDFQQDVCKIPYRIVPERLHKGNNFGSIRLNTAKESWVIPFQVEGDETEDASYVSSSRFRQAFLRFISLRLEEALGGTDSSELCQRMLQELDIMQNVPGDKNLAVLWMAETLIRIGKEEQALRRLEECRNEILLSRRDMIEYYCFYQYLSQKLKPNPSQKESLLRMVKKQLSAGKYPFLFFIRLELDDTVKETPFTFLGDMKQLYENGFHSPFLYLHAYQLFKTHPEFLQRMDEFTIQVLHFAAKKEIVDEKMAVRIAKMAGSEKYYQIWYHRLLERLYQKYPKKEILSAVCCMMIKGECKKAEDFKWYEKALDSKINLTRLYEYYLYSLPEHYDRLLPKEVLLYFSYADAPDDTCSSALYQNMLRFMKPSSKIYQTYERDMEQFAMKQLFQSRISSSLAVIYDHMIFKDMIDKPVAKVLPAILRSYRIFCRNRQMKYVVIRYEELTKEDAYVLSDGIAFVPLFSDKAVILFQDAFGNRYYDVSYMKTPVMNKPELLEQCFKVNPEHAMLCLAACREISAQDSINEKQVLVLERAIKELPFNELYRKVLLGSVIHYYRNLVEEENSRTSECAYLLTLDTKTMSKKERVLVCETLISQNYLEEAYHMIKTYGWEAIGHRFLAKLCSKMILQSLFDEDVFLLKVSFLVFKAGKADSVILDYLCEHFNGNSSQMFKLLFQSSSAKVELYDLDERLLCQMMFSGNVKRLEQTFSFYSKRKRLNETVMKAYFTVKSIGYFLKHEPADEKVFAYLESTVNRAEDLEKVSQIYLLALTKYYSECRELELDQKALCKRITDLLIKEGLIFPYTKKLSSFVRIPQYIRDKAMICFEGNKEDQLQLFIRILPDEESFHREELRRIYEGIFVCQKVLFEGEKLEYKIYRYEKDEGEKIKAAEGTILYELSDGEAKETRFASLNDMGLCLSMKEEKGLKKSMQEYLMRNAALEELFPVVE
ncbi:MAG: hypothetical protein HFG49_10540 [Lachnospiraceae bacterium]|jgi:hypothetical protein|nr:hypothetical protein [Lachnospiraceae bacterium]